MDNSASDVNLAQRLEGVVLDSRYQPEQPLSPGQLPGPVRLYQIQFSSSPKIPTNIGMIQRGENCLIADGGSYTTWYYYLRMDGTHALIWRIASLDGSDRFFGRELSARPWYDPEMQQVHFGDEPPVNGSQYEP